MNRDAQGFVGVLEVTAVSNGASVEKRLMIGRKIGAKTEEKNDKRQKKKNKNKKINKKNKLIN